MKERVIYFEKDGVFIGRLVNYPIISEAATAGELLDKLHDMFKAYAKYTLDIANSSQPFELDFKEYLL